MQFRFPGHEGKKMVHSDLGPVPEKWPVVAATEAVVVRPSTRVSKEQELAYVPMASLSETSMIIGPFGRRAGGSGTRFKNGDTVFARITPCLENGKIGFIQFLDGEDAVGLGSTEFIVLRSRSLSPEIVYLMARSESFRSLAIKSMTGATGRQRVQESCFEKFRFAHPDQETIERFTATVRPMFRYIQTLSEQSEVLRQLRDMLLPKLVTGDLEMSGNQEDNVLVEAMV